MVTQEVGEKFAGACECSLKAVASANSEMPSLPALHSLMTSRIGTPHLFELRLSEHVELDFLVKDNHTKLRDHVSVDARRQVPRPFT